MMTKPSLQKYQTWFYAAALYNLAWGVLNVLTPTAYLNLLGLPTPTFLPYWQVVGMFVLVYAPAYWWAGRFPERHAHLILIGLLGKLCGPIGFLYSALTGQLPWAFGWVILTNDLIWWPAFMAYIRDVSQTHGGFYKLLQGE